MRGLIKNRCLAIIFMVASLAVMAACFNFGGPLNYEDLKFTDRQSLVALTEIQSFPEFEYLDNSGTGKVRFVFKEEPDTLFFQIIDSLMELEDNLFWSLNMVRSDADKQFFGCDFIYILSRGWDGKYIKAPSTEMPEDADVELFIGEKGFICGYSTFSNHSCDEFGNRDSISAIIGIQFPSYKSVNCHYYPCGWDDWTEEWVIQLDELPSEDFIQQIKTSPNWVQLEDSSYMFVKDSPGYYYETIKIKEGSKIVTAEFGKV